jgi:phage gpG-like protein
MTGITRSFRSYLSPEDNNRAAVVITNKEIDAVLITQISNSDIVLLEIEYKNNKAFIASAYFDITTKIEDELSRLDQILELTKKQGIVIAVDSNSRSPAWHDVKTNKRGKILEEYTISKDLYVMNKSSA